MSTEGEEAPPADPPVTVEGAGEEETAAGGDEVPPPEEAPPAAEGEEAQDADAAPPAETEAAGGDAPQEGGGDEAEQPQEGGEEAAPPASGEGEGAQEGGAGEGGETQAGGEGAAPAGEEAGEQPPPADAPAEAEGGAAAEGSEETPAPAEEAAPAAAEGEEAPAAAEAAPAAGGDAPAAEDAAAAAAPAEEGAAVAAEDGGAGGGEVAAAAGEGGEGEEGAEDELDGLDEADMKEADGEEQEMQTSVEKKEYDVEKLRAERALIDRRNYLPTDAVSLAHSFGFETQRRNNLHRLGESTLLCSAGNSVMILDIQTLKQEFLLGIDPGGIGAITVHPSGNFFAVGEKGPNPNVYVYEWPSRQLARVLSGGTERAFADVRFSNDGKMLATVGSAPDYLLHIWDWDKEGILLRAKAFSQEVFNVSFSPRFDGTLYTSGQGHIRFWKMADTFTGLKLQGEIGKFGAIELSDISAYLELNDGKVLSGSESGNLLLWDGGLVKVELQCEGKPCHEGMVEMLWQHGERVVSAGVDGYLRFWETNQIDLAEPSDDEPVCRIKPVLEFKIEGKEANATDSEGPSPGVKVKTMHLDPEGKYKEWLVQDDAGALWRINYGLLESTQVCSFHAGPVMGCQTSPRGLFVASAGSDGTVRLHSLEEKSTMYTQAFAQPATCICWAPKEVDPDQTSVAVGFGDGVVRVLQQTADSWKLSLVFKPHTQPVVSLAFSPQGHRLASASMDGTVFWQNVVPAKEGSEHPHSDFEPIGFVKCSGPVICIAWSPDGKRLLACVEGTGGRDGELLEFTCPDPESVDTSTTFDLTETLASRPYLFEKKIILPEKPAKEKKEGEDEDEEEEEVVMPEVFPPGTPRACMYASENSFVVGYDGVDTTGMLYECTFDFKHPLKELEAHKSAICFLSVSHSGQFLISGATDGSVALRPIAAPEASSANYLAKCWVGSLHGIDARVTGAALSLDDRMLLTAGMDGNLLMSDVTQEFHNAVADALAVSAAALQDKAIADAEALRIEALKKKEEVVEMEPEPEDIKDPSHYSIQQEKIQAEEDRRLAEAEKKKEELRQMVLAIRKEFEQLQSSNAELPPAEQLGPDEFEVDPELRVLLEQEASSKVEEARKELAWESEKKGIGLAKLKAAFLDQVAVEHIELHSLRAPFRVASFRTKKLTAEQRENIDAVHALIAAEEAGKKGKDGGTGGEGGGEGGREGGGGKTAGGADGGEGEGDVIQEELEARGVPKAEIRKILRQQRQRKWEQLLASKPDDKYEDPKDVAAMEHAKYHMGDYKLKTDDDYVVPEHLRINADKKRRQMILLEESVYTIRMGFNDRLLALRDLKQRIVTNIAADNQRIQEINEQLGIRGESLWRPELEPDEFPEKRFEFTESELETFATQQKGGGGGGFGGGGGGGGGSPVKQGGGAGGTAGGGGGAAAAAAAGAGGGVMVEQGQGGEYEMSEMEKVQAYVREKQLHYEKERLQEKVENTVKAFDDAVRNLRRERFKLDADLKMTDLRMLVLFQELRLLKEFEKRDNDLIGRLDQKREEKAEMVAKISDCQEKLAARKAEIDKLNPRQVQAELATLVPETNKFHEQLQKIFKKKIKRQKKKALKEGEDEEASEDGSDESEGDLSDLDEEEEEEEEEFCPPGCDPALYEQVCELREKRLDQEEVAAEFQKAVEGLKKDNEALVKKEKIVDLALKQTEQEIQQFQTFKQQRLNELHVVITLKMHQVKCLVSGKLPPDLSHTIVFTNQGLRRLRERIDELKDEKEELKRNHKQLKREHVQLLKSKKVKEEKLKELEARARDVQMLKFGQEVDLEVLEKMSVNKTAEELKQQLKKLEGKNSRELKAWQVQIDEAAAELASVTKQNTEKLERVAELTSAQHRLEKELNSTQSRMVAEVGPSKEKMKAEREQLVSLVKLQAREMEALKAEINMLRRKGGHVYTPVVRRGNPGASAGSNPM